MFRGHHDKEHAPHEAEETSVHDNEEGSAMERRMMCRGTAGGVAVVVKGRGEVARVKRSAATVSWGQQPSLRMVR
jgi:hypothetical protein